MLKYVIDQIGFPKEISDIIYSYVDVLHEIKNLNEVWYKRLISKDIIYYSPNYTNLYLKNEENMLNALLKQKAYTIIRNIHKHNLIKCDRKDKIQ